MEANENGTQKPEYNQQGEKEEKEGGLEKEEQRW